MKNATYGFEHLEHRYEVLCHAKPPFISIDNRVSISDALAYHFGPDFTPEPQMAGLMKLNEWNDRRFLAGAEEAACYRGKRHADLLRVTSSTQSKVEFFCEALSRAAKGRLKTNSRGVLVRTDRWLDGRVARLILFVSGCLGLPAGAIAIISYIW